MQLPTLEEFIVELIPEIRIKKRRGQASMVMSGIHSDLVIYEPLVLLDLVPVFDLNTFLNISYEDIQRIEVVNATYARGDMRFGGIISVFSRKGDLAGIDLQKNTYFFDCQSFEPQEPLRLPEYAGTSPDRRIPDFRNTIYWNPDVKGMPGETLLLDFFTPDNQGEYTILVRGVSPDGTILKGQSTLMVK